MIGSIVSNIIVAVIVLGFIIVIHELGHFLVAKLFSIRVDVFSVGFGPRLLGRRWGDTDYRISAFPLGGYVKMAGENPTDTVMGEPHEFLSKPKWQRLLVAAAGPFMNMILAVGLLTGLYMYGSEIPEFLQNQATVGVIEPESPAAQAGVEPGDRILAIDGTEDPTWRDVEATVLTSPERPLRLRLDRNGETVETTVTPLRRGRAEMGYIGMGPHIRVRVQRVHPGYPAEEAGLEPGDEIVAVARTNLQTAGRSIQEMIQAVPAETFPITILREGEQIEVGVTPVVQDGRRVIGIDIPLPMVFIKLGPLDALRRSVRINFDNAALIFDVLGKLVRREASMKSLDGPIGIVRVSGQAFNAGMTTLVSLVALISLNLGLLNLLPIPILDGGVIMLLLVESVIRRDLSLRVKERIVQVSFVFLLMLTVFVLYNDIVKLLPPSQPSP